MKYFWITNELNCFCCHLAEIWMFTAEIQAAYFLVQQTSENKTVVSNYRWAWLMIPQIALHLSRLRSQREKKCRVYPHIYSQINVLKHAQNAQEWLINLSEELNARISTLNTGTSLKQISVRCRFVLCVLSHWKIQKIHQIQIIIKSRFVSSSFQYQGWWISCTDFYLINSTDARFTILDRGTSLTEVVTSLNFMYF